MSEPKRQRIEPSDLRIEVKVSHNYGDVIEGNFSHFVDREAIANAVEEQLQKTNEKDLRKRNERQDRVLKLVKTVLPQATCVYWEEEGGLEDVEMAQSFEGSRYNLSEEFDLSYDLDIFIGFSTTEDTESKDGESGLSLSFDASLSTDVDSGKVFFEFSRRKLSFCITNWQTDTINPSAEEIRNILIELVKQEIGGMEACYLKKDIKEIDMVKEMANCPRFIEDEEDS